MAKKKYEAKKHHVVGHGPSAQHFAVQTGDVYEVDEDFAEEHLVPQGLAEESDKPLSSVAKKEARAAAKSAKASAASPKKGEDADEKKKGK